MANLLQRDSESGGNGGLSTGAIAGIAGGIGALFLGAAGLFIVYWRRQRQFDREEDDSQDSCDEMGPPGMAPALTYTMDYKMDHQHTEGDQASTYTYSPEKLAYSSSTPGAAEVTSAMPTHPAYIPRALVRGATTPSTHSTTNTPRQFPSPPPSSKYQPDDAVIQAYLAAASENQASSSTQSPDISREPDPSPAGLPPRPSQRQSPTHVPGLVMPAFPSPPPGPSTEPTTTKKKPRAYIPPRLNLTGSTTTRQGPGSSGPSSGGPSSGGPGSGGSTGTYTGDKPLSGRENTTISGPLAFPQHYQPPPSHSQPKPNNRKSSKSKSKWDRDQTTTDNDDTYDYDDDGELTDRRTFRSRAAQAQAQDQQQQGKKGRRRSERNSGNRHYAEIEIGRGSDIW